MDKCYQCKAKLPPNRKYFCTDSCRDKFWGSKRKLTIPEIQARLLEMGKRISENKKQEDDIIKEAKRIFDID